MQVLCLGTPPSTSAVLELCSNLEHSLLSCFHGSQLSCNILRAVEYRVLELISKAGEALADKVVF